MGGSEFLGAQDGKRQVDEAGERDDGDDGVVHGGGPDGGASAKAPAEEDEADREREERNREQRE
jgi:hypothetical protein